MKKSIAIIALFLLVLCNIAKAEETRLDNAILINAEEILYNDKLQVINAFGNVELVKNNSIVWADSITYNKVQDIIIAKGNITFKDETGNVSYGSFMKFNKNMQTGFIKSPQGRLVDDTRIAASSATKESESITTLKNAVYSPCEICQGDENPIWQIKAKKVIRDEDSLNIVYRNAWLEVYGTPIFYTPYLTHPDPQVKRRSGWLPSSIENSSNSGLMIRNYYYWDIASNTDATIEFTLMDLVKTPLIGGEFRHLFKNGEINVSGSLIMDDSIDTSGNVSETNKMLGHIFVDGKFDIDEHWRSSFSLKGVSDKNYFERYNFETENDDMLTSKAVLEGFYGDDYIAFKAYKFKDLRPNIIEKQPFIFPSIEYSMKENKEHYNWISEGDFLVLDQEKEGSEFRLYNQTGIEQSYLSTFGLNLDLSADLYTKAYALKNDDPSVPDTIVDIIPQLYMLAKYPLQKKFEDGSSTIIEPIANLIISPNNANDENTPLEDSTVLNLDYSNLFSKNRLSGVDRLEDGVRSSYGIKTSFLKENGGYSSIFLGQAFRSKENPYLFPENSGLEDKFSDIILELQLKPNRFLNLDYTSLLDKDDLTDKTHEVYFSVGKKVFKLMGSYIYTKDNIYNVDNYNSQELKVAFISELNKYWILSGSSTTSLGADGDGLLKSSLNLEYRDECFTIGLYGEKDRTNRKGAAAETKIMLRFGLKNIGDIKTPTLSADFLNGNSSE